MVTLSSYGNLSYNKYGKFFCFMGDKSEIWLLYRHMVTYHITSESNHKCDMVTLYK